MMRALHVAALPFPSPQGTQAALSCMLQALGQHGHVAELLVYARGQGTPPAEVRVQRLRDVPPVRSLRSGPSLGKLLLDTQLAWALPRRARQARASLLVAHHVEAAAAAWLRSPTPWVFFAHTDLEGELPSYASPRWAGLLSRGGRFLESRLLHESAAVAAISPLLAERFAARHGVSARYVPPPWPVPPPTSMQERLQARETLRMSADAQVMLYAGNLDAYQGWPTCVYALANGAAGRRLVVATASDPGPLRAVARRAGVGDRLHVMPLQTERHRRLAHAAADVVLVPRQVSGGLPIKLLDALSRGVPTVAMRGGAAGLRLEEGAWLCDDRADAFAAAVDHAFRSREASRHRGRNGRRFVAREHSSEKFSSAYRALCRIALKPPSSAHGEVDGLDEESQGAEPCEAFRCAP